jgi:ribonuclease P protein component
LTRLSVWSEGPRNTRRWIPDSTYDTLDTCRRGTEFNRETGAHFHAKAHISTKPPETGEDTRFSRADEDQERGSCAEPASRDRPQARVGERGIPRLSLGVEAGASHATKQAPATRPAATQMNAPHPSFRPITQRSAANPQIPIGIKQSLAGMRLKKHADFQRAYAASRKRQSASMSWFLAPQDGGEEGRVASRRVGLTVGKVLGKANERNRIKRRMREALRRQVELLPEGCDLILHPRRIVLTMEFGKLEAEIVRILHQAQAEAARLKRPAGEPAEAGARKAAV